MTTKRRQIAFYADDVVGSWYAQLAPGEGTRRINEYLRAAIKQEQQQNERMINLEQELKSLSDCQDADAKTLERIIEILKDLLKVQMTIYSAGRVGDVQKIDAEYDRLKDSLAVANNWHSTRGI